MKELLLYMAKNLVDEPEAVTVTEVSDEEGKVLELRVAPGDMGKVIGKHGKIARAIRLVIKSALSGKSVRFELSNECAKNDVEIGSVTVSKCNENGDFTEDYKFITFKGEKLYIKSLNSSGMIICGTIIGIEFSTL